MKYKINKGFISEQLDGKTVIFDAEESILYTFNETASYVFKKIKEGKNESKIIELLIVRYKIKQERAEKDLKNVITQFLKSRIIRT